MSDIAFPRPVLPLRLIPACVMALLALFLLALFLLLALRWSAVMTDSARTCERTRGGFSVGFNAGFDVVHCERFLGFAEAGPTSGTFGEAPFFFRP